MKEKKVYTAYIITDDQLKLLNQWLSWIGDGIRLIAFGIIVILFALLIILAKLI